MTLMAPTHPTAAADVATNWAALPLQAFDLMASHAEIGAVINEARSDMIGTLEPLIDALEPFHTPPPTGQVVPDAVRDTLVFLSATLVCSTELGLPFDEAHVTDFTAAHEALGEAIVISFPGLAGHGTLPLTPL